MSTVYKKFQAFGSDNPYDFLKPHQHRWGSLLFKKNVYNNMKINQLTNFLSKEKINADY